MRRRRDIFDEIRRLFDEMMWEYPSPWQPQKALPGAGYPTRREAYTNMVETDKEVIFTAELPGVKKDNIDINVTENRIDVSVEAEEKEEKEEAGKYSYFSRYSGFKSSYPTPVPVDAEKAEANYKNGVLEIKAPKLEVKKKKKIEVK